MGNLGLIAMTVAADRPQTLEASSATETFPQERVERSLDALEQLGSALVEPDRFVAPPGFLLSVVIPVYNEEATIVQVIESLRALPLPVELLIIDDCSTDGTRNILRRYENDEDIRIVYKPKNEGKGAALRTGFALARGDVVVVQDADLEYDPRDLPRLVQPIIEGRADVVYGSRYLSDRHESAEFRQRRQRDPSLVHWLGNALLTWASNCFTGLRLTDMETCYKAFRRDVIQRIELQQDRFGFEPEVTAKIARHKYRVCETPISYRPRTYAEGKKIGIRDLFNALFCIVQYGVWERGN